MDEPLTHFYRLYGFYPGRIRRLVTGAKYVGVMLDNGCTGVCSVLETNVPGDLSGVGQPDLNSVPHRILYNAYLNALLNYNNEFAEEKDIFDHHLFQDCRNITMIGYFKPLVEKFAGRGIELTIFDMDNDDEVLTPLDQMNSVLTNSEIVILTSTTLFNGSFMEIIEKTPHGCRVMMLGPSSILHPDLKQYRNITNIYGAVFEPHDETILDLIAHGHGARTFLKHSNKVSI